MVNSCFVYVAYCDYTRAVSFEHGNAFGSYPVLDIDSHHVGEPIFNGCRPLTALIDRACVYTDATMPDDENVALNRHLHVRIPRDNTVSPARPSNR